MARHLMAVCVVCLLCAEHLPCKHVDDNVLSAKGLLENDNNRLVSQNYMDISYLTGKNTVLEETVPNKRKGRTKNHNEQSYSDKEPALQKLKNRDKRHAVHVHHDDEEAEVHKISNLYIRKIFENFAGGDKMNVIELEEIMRKLNLQLVDQNQISTESHVVKQSTDLNDTCISSIDFVQRISSEHYPSGQLQISSLNDSIQSIKENLHINKEDFRAICPILLYHAADRSDCIPSSLVPDDLHNHEDALHVGDHDRTYVWIYATLSILGTSLCGLLGVAVIPFMEKEYYNSILQFLVALAVGTLAGDALLHLLPHAMMTFAKGSDPHITMPLKGLVATLGVLFFFVFERLLTMIAEWRKTIEKKEKPSSRTRVMRDPESTSKQKSAPGKECKHKYSSYPYCYDEIAKDTKGDHHHHKNGHSPVSSENHNSKSHDHSDYLDAAQNLLATNNYSIPDGYAAFKAATEDGHVDGNTSLENGSNETKDKSTMKEESYTIILREHESKHHGHSHAHGHVHSPPRSMSAVAWMVIMGDGLHNFTDGMAIGAAFSNNLAGGFSTAIAVFCHELPHELGDFAVLLKAGMSARQAVYYNVLSSVLSFFGTIIGILVGDTPEASSWIFACAAGTFIYIALVDMMPELTTSHQEGFAFSRLLLQIVGISTGIGIMLIIAIYEQDLKSLFLPNQHVHQH
ncbi:Zinc transporter foi [Pseudolycoriella hygida]|uniref:Zinc transporter foi n=1 Tax=Pseudolycoriella hygida TaxID=35572 RepID=A0A9Q0N4T1_9DIPT|nr:Zinc transporter foi [Pseudolycoriella hygida]